MSTAVVQCLAILEILADSSDGLKITAVSKRLGLNKAIPHRHLNLLESEGYVERRGDNYFLTFKVGALGLRQLRGAHIDDWAQPVLDQLARDSGELVHLAAYDEGQLSWIAMAQGTRQGLRLDPAAGDQAPLISTASGRAVLSTYDEVELRKLLATVEPVRLTPHTITEPSALAQRIRVARKAGFAVVIDERELGVSAVAAPVSSPRPGGRPLGALSVAGPTARLDKQRLKVIGAQVVKAANSLSKLWPVFRGIENDVRVSV